MTLEGSPVARLPITPPTVGAPLVGARVIMPTRQSQIKIPRIPFIPFIPVKNSPD